MFGYLYEWAQNLAVYLILITAVLHALPDSDYKKYIRFFTGLVLTFMMLTPVLKILGTDGQIMNFYKSREYEKEIEEIEKASQYLEEYGGKENIDDIRGEREKTESSAGNINEIEIEEIKTGENHR